MLQLVNLLLPNGCHALETVRSTRSRGNPAIGVEAHRALTIDIPNPRAFMLNIGCGQFQSDVYDMAIYVFSAIESVIWVRQPCLLFPRSFSVAQGSAGTVPWLPFRSDIIALRGLQQGNRCFALSIYPQVCVPTETLL